MTDAVRTEVAAAPDAPRYDFARRRAAVAAPPGPSAAASASPTCPTDGKPKYYVLEMFPYPSGKIHMGHVRNYTLGDVVARYKRARGFAVLHPMGWDAFGLPAENAARERGIHPAKWTWDNIAAMRAELQRMGLSLDWEREFATCDPAYYGHQQKLFLDFLRAGLVERKESWVNWDPVDGTVLANEQVIDGRGWRSGAPVEKKQLSSGSCASPSTRRSCWRRSDSMDRWPERVRLMQANWIGRSEGARLRVRAGPARRRPTAIAPTSRSTPPGRTRCSACRSWRSRRNIRWPPRSPRAIPPPPRSSPNAAAWAPARRRSRPRRSTATTPACACAHPFIEGATYPVWIANFVLMEYGTGAIFGCPGARPARPRVRAQIRPAASCRSCCRRAPIRPASRSATRPMSAPAPLFNSGFLDGLEVEAAKRAAIAELERARRRPRRGELAAARLGRVAPALLGLPDPGDPLRRVRRRAGARRRSFRCACRTT